MDFAQMLSVPTAAASHTQLAVLSCLFSTRITPRIVANYWRFRHAVEQLGIPCYTIECRYATDDWVLPLDGTVLRRTASTLGWHKERLLNILERYVPLRYTKLAWVDADILFEEPAWAHLAETRLDSIKVIQLFSFARWLCRDGRGYPDNDSPEHRALAGVVAQLRRVGADATLFELGHPGFAWAAQRDIWRGFGGLCDRVLSMDADSVMACAFMQAPLTSVRPHSLSDSVQHWYDKACRVVGGSVDFIPGTVSHLWHGHWSNRQYLSLPVRFHALQCPLDELVLDDPECPLDQPRVTVNQDALAIYEDYFAVRNRTDAQVDTVT